MELADYHKKRRRAMAFKLAAFFLILLLTALAVWGIMRVFNVSGIQQVLKTYGFGSSELPEKARTPAAPWLIFCLPDTCFYTDTKGVLSENAPRFSENPLPELVISGMRDIKIGDKIMEDGAVKFLNDFFGGSKGIGAEALRVEIKRKDAKIVLKEGWYILISFDVSAEEAVGNLKMLLNQKIREKRAELDYIDLRFPAKAFYKLKSKN